MTDNQPVLLILKNNQFKIIVFLLIFILSIFLPTQLILTTDSLNGYLPIHSLMETFAIIVSMITFIMGWENRSENKYQNTIIISVAYLSVAIIDFGHLFSFPGMPHFVTPSSANKSIFLWLSGRFTIAASMLYLVSSSPRAFKNQKNKYPILFIALTYCAIIYLVAFRYLHLLPDFYLDGIGLTPFKIFCETLVILILIATIIILLKRSRILFDSYDLSNIFMAIVLMILSESYFMIFSGHTDLYNFLGHVYKVLSYFFFYKALFKESIQTPYDELDQRNVELQLAKAAADEASVAKSQFLANMSHEIRTPMNAIVGLTELIDEARNKPEQVEYINLLKQSEEHLLGLVNNILTLSRIEAGLIDTTKVKFNLKTELQKIEHILKIVAQKKNIDLLLKTSSQIPNEMYGDLNKLNQILFNLVDNAIKFTNEGHVHIIADVLSINEQSVSISIIVKDTGIGIPANKLNLLFQNFSQIDNSSTRKYGGSGLGLAISKKLVEVMQGEIWIESIENQGSTFHLNLTFQLHE